MFVLFRIFLFVENSPIVKHFLKLAEKLVAMNEHQECVRIFADHKNWGLKKKSISECGLFYYKYNYMR